MLLLDRQLRGGGGGGRAEAARPAEVPQQRPHPLPAVWACGSRLTSIQDICSSQHMDTVIGSVVDPDPGLC